MAGRAVSRQEKWENGAFCSRDNHPGELCHVRVASQPRALLWGGIWRGEESGKQKMRILAGGERRECSCESREVELGGL